MQTLHRIVAVAFVALQLLATSQALAQTQAVTAVIVRHPEVADALLTPAGHQRAELLVQTFRDIKFTHVFASHTKRARQTAEPIAAAQRLPIVQLPTPGSMLDGQPVTDSTSRQAAIEPIANAVLRLPAGSVALIAGNSDNIYGILNRLGIPVAAAGQKCAVGSMCVPCVNNTCFPGNDFDRLWYLIVEPGRPRVMAMIETRYGVGWSPKE